MSEAQIRAWELREEARNIVDDVDEMPCLGDIDTDLCGGCHVSRPCKEQCRGRMT